MGIRPGKPSLSAGASCALPCSPIRWMLSDYLSILTIWPLLLPQSHLVWSSTIVFEQRSLHSFTLVHPAMPWDFCSSNVKGGCPFVKAQESAGHLSGGIRYPHPIKVAFYCSLNIKGGFFYVGC
uniref:Uncharacterized protein n=1 Tax=Solanum lycopersicum TaxID=4081 RepID=K4DEP6_SOLLC